MGCNQSTAGKSAPRESRANVDEQTYMFLCKVKLLKRLPKDELPALAKQATEVLFKPGESIITQGEEGSDFYMIKKGTADVEINGKTVASLKAGDYFGENALLRNEPRNATIKATKEVVTLKITRKSFMSLGLQDKLEFPKRGAVGGGAQVQAEVKPPSSKSDADVTLIKKALQENVNLNTIANLDDVRMKAMCDVMWKEDVAEGTALIKQNDLQADYFYIVQQGSFAVSKAEGDGKEGTSLEAAATAQLGTIEAVQDKADEFHSRQLALTLHSFSLLNTSYGRMLQNMAPQVLSTLNMADHQSAAMVFCAYARAGQVHSEVLQALAEKLYLGVAEAGEQMQVQLFYACGRFGLYKEPLSIALAELLQQNVRTLSGQHLANCLLTLSRLSLCNEQFASLQAALQARLLRRDVHFEPQHLANSLYALAGIYGDGAPPQAALSSPLPGSVVPRLVDEVVQGSTWQQNPQLLASVAIASARLRQGSPELFSLVSQTVRRDVARGTPKLSKQNQSELLWSFAVSGFFDLQLFSWVMSQLDAGSLSSVPMDVLLSTLQCLDYVSFSGQLNEQETDTFTEPEHWQGAEGGTLHSLLFLQCPASFQLQALNFYQRVGLTLLLHSPKLPAKVLEIVAPAFARAGLLEAVPFDLLKPSTADFFGEAASAIPPEPPLAVLPTPEESKDGLDTGAASTSLMELWLEELSCQEGGSSSSSRPCGSTRLAYLLARYAKLLPGTSSSLEELPSVPGVVLDPLLRKMGAVLRDSAQNLSFEELAETLATLADAGIRPTDVWEALTEAAEARDFPSVHTPNAAEKVAALLYGFSGRSSRRLQDRLEHFMQQLAEVSATKLGLRPLQTAARLLAALDVQSSHQASRMTALLQSAMMEAENLSEGCGFDDVTDLLYALEPWSQPMWRGNGHNDALPPFPRHEDVVQLQGWLCASVSSTKPGKLLELLHTLSMSRGATEYCSLELLTILASELLAQSQVLGGAGLALALQAFGRLRVLQVINGGHVDGGVSQEGKLPRLVAALLRSLLVLERQLSLSDAAKAAHFCALCAMDSPLLTEAERAEAKDGLARLLERLSWEQKRWSLEDRKLLTEVATLLRSEYPELLRSGWVARSVITTLEILR